MAIKVDICKAFDTMDWDFLLEVLNAFGFSDILIIWIHNVLKSMRLSVLVNGSPTGYFLCSCGVHQGDPLSPLLFCIVEEVLTRYLTYSVTNGSLQPMEARRSLSVPSYLLYANDVLLLCRVSITNYRQISLILEDYVNISGQQYNPNKTKVYFGIPVEPYVRWFICMHLGISSKILSFNYLGVPLFIGIPQKMYLQPIADRIFAKFAWWKWSTLSMARRLCLVQSMVLSSLTHSMMIYRWPQSLLKVIDTAVKKIYLDKWYFT